jgi:multidrug efflux pump subunit AcrB
MTNITQLALTKRTVMATLFGLVFVAGIATYFTMPREEDPGFKPRNAIVSTPYPGASPAQVERLVTDPLEEEIRRMPELEYLESESRKGVSVIEVVIADRYTDLESIWSTLRDRVNDVAPRLPEGIRGPVVNDDYGDVYNTVVAMTGEGLSYAQMETVAEEVKKRLRGLPYAAKVQLQGLREERIFVEYNAERLSALGLSVTQLSQILESRNIILGGGDVTSGRERIDLNPSGSFDSVESLRQMTFTLPNGDLVALQDVATVEHGYADPPRSLTRYNGEPAISIAVSMKDDGKVTNLGPKILNALEQMKSQLPAGIAFHTVSYRASIVDGLVQEFTGSLLQGILAVIFVMLFFLGLRTGAIVATAIPMTMVASVLVMSVLGISLNKMSLAALIIALGMLVDDSIVMCESILVKMRQGANAFKAAIESVRELYIPLLITSLTTIAALLPIYLANHIVGEYVSAIFEVVAIAMLGSWVLSFTLMPMLCSLYLRVDDRTDASERETTWWNPATWDVSTGRLFGDGSDGSAPARSAEDEPDRASDDASDGTYDTPFYARYRRFLLRVVQHPWLSLGLSAALLAVSVGAMRFLPEQFFPLRQETLFKAEIEMPYGTSIDHTKDVVADLEGFMQDSLMASPRTPHGELYTVPRTKNTEFDEQGLVNWASFIGQGAPRFILSYRPEQPRTNYAYLLLNTSNYDVQSRIVDRMEAYLERTHPETTPRIETLRNGPPIDYPVAIRIRGTDKKQLFQIADRVKKRLDGMEGVVNVTDDWGPPQKQLDVTIDDTRARRAGLTNRDVALSLQANLSGIPLTVFREGNNPIPVVLRSSEANTRSPEALAGLDVHSQQTGQAVPLRQVADLDLSFQPGRIQRRDRQMTVTVQADISPTADRSITPFSVVQTIEPWLQEQQQAWPFGYDYAFGGEPENSGDVQNKIRNQAPIAILVIVLLLVMQFNSLRKPLIIFLTLPFALTGVVIGLLMTQLPFDFMALLGVIALFGVVMNNAVVLIDRIETEINAFGRSPQEAVIQASQRRLRPILLSVATTICGLIPLWVVGNVMFVPMAVAMIFGLLAATLLSLALVPMFYTLFYRLRYDDFELATMDLSSAAERGTEADGASSDAPDADAPDADAPDADAPSSRNGSSGRTLRQEAEAVGS